MERRGVVSPDSALAADVFDQFCSAGTLKSILGHFRHLCQLLHIQPTNFPHFYPKLKAKLRSWKAQALWNKYDKRASHKCYNRGKTSPNTRVLVIGAGPCGLRAAIEAQLLGAKVVVVEKRDRISRNNVLHLWPFVIHDLRGLGAKKFFGRFCAGAIDHISIRQLQCILLKVALIFGVEIHEGVGFESLLPPPEDQNERIGWRAVVTPADHPMSQYEFDVLIGADGKRNTLEGFRRKEFRGKLAIAITANFINRHTEAEARVEEISGVAFIFNQKFFKDLYATTGIDLENIVYYKDDTHYFVMTAKKHSLIDKGVILNDYTDTARLLAPENVDKVALMEYAREAADFSTGCKLPQLEFAVNHYGQPDVAMFDFTSMYAAENASRVIDKNGHRLLMILVGDSLLEPFWPTGSGCARGFLSCLDAAWAVRSWAEGAHPLKVLAERESIYRLLAQTTPENLHRDLNSYTLDPHTRYPNLNIHAVLPVQVQNLFVTDDLAAKEQFLKAPNFQTLQEVPKKRRRRDSQVHPDTLLHWLQKQVALYDNVRIDDMSTSFRDGLALCAIIHRYRPHLIDYYSLNKDDVAKNNQLAFDILERELAIPPVMTGEEMAICEVPDKLALLSYLSQVYDAFRGEIPYIKHPKLEETEEGKEDANRAHAMRLKHLAQMTPAQRVSLLGKLAGKTPIKHTHSGQRKRRSNPPSEEMEERRKCIEEIDKNRQERMMRRKYLRHIANQQFYKSMQMLQSNCKSDKNDPFEDYSLFVYRQTAPDFKDRVKMIENKLLYPDRDNRIILDSSKKGGTDEGFSGRVKDLEAKLRGAHSDKKPKDLLRAIGKIEKSDWNVKEIEKKIEENKMGRGLVKKAERVPKWDKQAFEDKFSAMERKLQGRRQEPELDNKFVEIDTKLQNLGKKLKEGTALELGQRGANKVSAMAAHLATMHQEPEPSKSITTNGKNAVVIPAGGSEMCHFCDKRVYLMERLSAEGKFFHRGCFRCQYCSTALRLGNYAFDRDGKYGSRFFCSQHFGMTGVAKERRKAQIDKSLDYAKDSVPLTPVRQPSVEEVVDVGNTPERIEFDLSENAEVEEDEWTDRNFGASEIEDDNDSDISESSSESQDEEAYAEALHAGGLDAEETLRLAQDWARRYTSNNPSDSHSSYQDGDTEGDDSDTATEGEEDIQARELRKQEVPQEVLKVHSDSGSETEVASDEYSESSSEEEEEHDNSATEISTDSEFEHDGTSHPIPDIVIGDTILVKRGELEQPKQAEIVNYKLNGKFQPPQNDVKLELRKIDVNPVRNNLNYNDKINKPFLNPNRGDYLLNRTHSTEGIASKISLELKKKYLLGSNDFSGNVRKSGSTSTIDTKFKSLIDQISEQQKLLNPAPEPSPIMQAVLQGADKIKTSPVVSSYPNLLSKKELPLCEEFKHVCSLKDLEKQHLEKSKEMRNKIEEERGKDGEREKSLAEVNKEIIDKIENEKMKEVPEVVGKEEEEDVRARSPVHETSILVPDFPRAVQEEEEDEDEDDIDSDSLSSDESTSEEDSIEPPVHSPPKLEIHNSRGELMEEDAPPLDSLNLHIPDVCQTEPEPSARDKMDLLPSTGLLDSIECSLKVITVPGNENGDSAGEVLKKVSTPAELYVTREHDRSSPDSQESLRDDSESFKNESLAAALTETELSDWARDEEGVVSEALDDLEFNINPQFLNFKKNQTSRSKKPARGVAAKIARAENFDDEFTHVCGKVEKPEDLPITSMLHNVEGFEFMDTGGESSTDEDGGVKNKVLRDSGYIQLVNRSEDEDELPTPIVEVPPHTAFAKDDDDSKLTEFTDTTTSEPTTVKNSPLDAVKPFDTSISSDSPVLSPKEPTRKENYDDYVKKLQGRVSPFSNVRDSIDVRKSRKYRLQSKSSEDTTTATSTSTSTTSPEELLHPVPVPVMPTPPSQPPSTLQTDTPKTTTLAGHVSPTTSRKLQQISKERSIQKDLVREMVLNKIKPQGKSPHERKYKRNSRGSTSPLSGILTSASSSMISSKGNAGSELKSVERWRSVNEVDGVRTGLRDKLDRPHSMYCTPENPGSSEDQFYTPASTFKQRAGDTPSSTVPRERAQTVSSLGLALRHNKFKLPQTPLTNPEAFSLPDIHKAVEREEFKTPCATPYLRSDLKASARAKYRMMTDEELGLSPEDKIRKLKEKVQKHLSSSHDKINISTPTTSKSVSESEGLKKSKEDRKRSIIQAVSDFFHKKSPSPPKTPSSQSPTKLLKFKSSRSKECIADDQPPPIPPPPQSYTPSHDDSLSEEDSKAIQSEENTWSSVKKLKMTQRLARLAQSKRLRLAQEMQRQLEEVEVKQRELEAQGVVLEKALRGEDSGLESTKDEGALLREWFRLMRERSALRRREKELMTQAQELELEDRHSRLELQLRHVMAKSEKGSEEMALEGRILREMLEIVERRNKLVSQLEADRLRYQEEDRDLEAQMSAKGLQPLTPLAPLHY